MSEAMSSVEIEDVLSSIRRLVSDDLRTPARPPTVKIPGDKLILTPAFRVVPDVPPPPAPPVRPAPLPRLHLGAEPVIEQVVATLERAVEAQDIEWESEVGDPAPLFAKMEWTETGWAAVIDPAPVAQPDPVPTPSWDQVDPEPTDLVMGASPLSDAAPAFAQADTYWADQAEAEAVADLRDELEAPPTSSAEIAFDEQVLRDLVRDILREELQGDLGSRITRNVRKLVRAEIARALAAQDLD